MRNTFKVVIMVVAVVAMCSTVMAQRPVVNTSPPVASGIAGFGQFLCSGPDCYDGPFALPYHGRMPAINPDTLSKASPYLGYPNGDAASAATVNASGNYSSFDIPWSTTAPYPVTPVLAVGLPDYPNRPATEVIEISFSGTPYVSMEALPQPYGSVGLGMATDCRVLENTQCDCDWDPAMGDAVWDSADAKACTGITRSGSNYIYPWFFSVYPAGTGLTQTYAVSYHGYMLVENECNFDCEPGSPMFVAKVRSSLAGYGLPNTGAPSQFYNFQRITAAHLIVNY